MANPTSNFNWQMPTSSDLVTDLPADFEVFGQAVDTSLADLKGGTTGQVLKKNSNTDMDFVWGADSAGMTNPMTTTGDIIYSSSGSTPARLGIGTTGQVLNVAGGVPAWTTPAGAGSNWSLLNAGGTALTGAQTVTVSGISGKDKIMVIINGGSSDSAQRAIGVRLNAQTGTIYYRWGIQFNNNASYSAGIFDTDSGNADYIKIATMTDTASSVVNGAVTFTGCNSSGVKQFQSSGGCTPASSNSGQLNVLTGYVDLSATITSISVYASAGNLDAGTVYVYTSA
jgi:hypothetical protein